MELFDNLVVTTAPPQPIAIVTPLGTVTSQTVVDDSRLELHTSSAFYVLTSGGFAMQWKGAMGVAEVLLTRPSLIPEYWSAITNCWAFLWRFKAVQPVRELAFKSSWMSGYTWTSGGSDCGQNLDAKTWDDSHTKVSIGTEDDVALFRRAQANDWLPRRLTHQSENEYSLALGCANDTGMSIVVEAVAPDETVQAHFVVAWSPYDEESIGTWQAVDLSAVHIIAGAAGYTTWPPHA